MNPDLERAILLVEQNRPQMAVEYFQRALGAEPENAMAHAAFSLCLASLEKFDDAEAAARQAIHLQPDSAFSYYALAQVLNERHRLREAAAAIHEAVRLDPDDADYWALMASVRGQQSHWHEALQAADAGLQHDPTHPGCINMRALCLQMTGRGAESVAASDAALARDPENPQSHYTRGLALLEAGRRHEAMYHFKECLRLEPNFQPAREGIVLALKSANPLYRPILKASFWLARGGAKWGIILPIGLWILVQVLNHAGRSNPAIEPYVDPIIYSYVAFVGLTWIGPHVFDLVVMLHPLGRIALTRRQKAAAFIIAALAAIGCGLVALYLTIGGILFLIFGVPLLFITIPVGGLFRAEAGWPRKLMMLILLVCVVLVLTVFGSIFTAATGEQILGLFAASLWACAIASWITIFVAPITPKR